MTQIYVMMAQTPDRRIVFVTSAMSREHARKIAAMKPSLWTWRVSDWRKDAADPAPDPETGGWRLAETFKL